MLNFSKSVLIKKQTAFLKAWVWAHFQKSFIFGWTISLTAGTGNHARWNKTVTCTQEAEWQQTSALPFNPKQARFPVTIWSWQQAYSNTFWSGSVELYHLKVIQPHVMSPREGDPSEHMTRWWHWNHNQLPNKAKSADLWGEHPFMEECDSQSRLITVA